MNMRLLYRVKEVAEMLGVGRSKAYELVRTGEIPAVRVGSSLRVRGEDVLAYVENLQESCEAKHGSAR